MHMVHCRACGHTVHVTAIACPKCNSPQAAAPENGSVHAVATNGSSRRTGALVATIAAVVIVIASVSAAVTPRKGSVDSTELARQSAEPAPVLQAAKRVISDAEAEDATADSVIAQLADNPVPQCNSLAAFMRQSWAMYIQMGRDPRFKTNFFRAMEQGEQRGCL